MMFASFAYAAWMRERRYRSERDRTQDEREAKKLELEEKRIEAAEQARYEEGRRQDERLTSDSAGVGSGGYIVTDMPEKDRALFHDLLKGFEDYARLKGYQIAFSIDSSLEGRIAFKFTVKNSGVVVGPERVRQDFKDYVEQVRNGKLEDLDKVPPATTPEEHDLLVTQLKNRITFLQHSYQLSKNAVQYYETLFANARAFPALPAPQVIVQTGGTMDSREYKAVNSQRLIQGDSNTYKDSSVNIDIGHSFNERQARIGALDDVIARLKASEEQNGALEKAQRELSKVRDELAEDQKPDESTIFKWMERAKKLMMTGILSYETVEAAKKLWEIFGLK